MKNYKEADKEVYRIAENIIDIIGLDNMIHTVIHAMVCECIDNDDIHRENRRKVILDRINKELNKWVD